MDNTNRAPLWQALGLAWELGYSIAIPLVVLALAGRWADKTFHTSPWLLLTGIGLSIISSSLLLVRKFSQIIKNIESKPKA